MYRLGLVIPTRTFFLGCFALSLAVAAVPRIGHAASSPEDTIRSFYSTLLATMKSGATLGIKGRYDQMAPAIRQDFDLLYMARRAVGPAWRELSDDQKKQVGDAFARYMIATYADNFDGYSGEMAKVTGYRPNPYGPLLQSTLHP